MNMRTREVDEAARLEAAGGTHPARIRPAEPPADDGQGSVTAGARFIAGSALVRASLISAATINFFNLMFAALYLLYAVRVLHIKAGVVGVLIGAAAVGALLGSVVTKRIAARIGAGWTYTAGCLLFTAPLVLWPLAHGSRWVVLAMLFAAEFGSKPGSRNGVERSRQRWHEHHRKVPYVAEKRSRSPAVAGVTGRNRSRLTAVHGPARA